ncbi:MAG: hypothetical protein V1493_04375, partial [Candidatus Diapherotrites archaeon]
MYVPFDFPQIVFLALFANFALLIVFLFLCSREIKAFFANVSRKTWFFLLLIFVFAFFLRLSFPPVHGDYSEGFWNIETANNMLTKGSAEMCQYEGFEQQCLQYRKPAAVQFIYALSFLFFGAGANAVFYANLIIGALLVFLVFLVAYAIFKDETIALFSSLIFSLLPFAVVFSRSL